MRVLLLLGLAVTGCRGCRADAGPAPREDLETVQAALQGGFDYERAVQVFEADPERGLMAVRQTHAAPGSREAFVRRILEAHLSDIKSFRRLQGKLDEASEGPRGILGPAVSPEKLKGLDDDDHVWFWAERALVPANANVASAAVAQLEAIATSEASEALFWLAATPQGSHTARGDAQRALGRLGKGRELARALGAWLREPVPESLRRQELGSLTASLALLPARVRGGAEQEMVQALSAETFDANERRGLVRALGIIGSTRSLEALAGFRQTGWGRALRDELDLAIGAIVTRAEDGAPEENKR